jgi:CRISPR system Cascade subunit CasE
VPVTFEGLLRVTDGNAFVSLLKNGLGPAKAFGCGLMLVKRI